MAGGKLYLSAPASRPMAFKKSFKPKLSMSYGKRKERKQQKTTNFISKVLNEGVKYISADYYNNTVMSFGNARYINDLVIRDIPKYDPNAVSDRAKNPQYARTSDALYFKGFNLKMSMCNYGDRNVLIRVLLFKNDSYSETLAPVTAANLFQDVYGNDWTPSSLSTVLPDQPFNRNLVRKSSNLLYDKSFILGSRTVEFPCWNGSGVATYTPIQPNASCLSNIRNKYVKVNHRIQFENDAIGEDLKNGKYYFLILWSNDTNEDKGTCVVNYRLSCTLAQS